MCKYDADRRLSTKLLYENVENLFDFMENISLEETNFIEKEYQKIGGFLFTLL